MKDTSGMGTNELVEWVNDKARVCEAVAEEDWMCRDQKLEEAAHFREIASRLAGLNPEAVRELVEAAQQMLPATSEVQATRELHEARHNLRNALARIEGKE